MKRYQDIPGWMDFEDFFAAMVAQGKDGDLFVEVGAHKGRSAAYLLEQIAASGKAIDVEAIERDPAIFAELVENLRGARGLLLRNIASLDAAADFPDGSLAFVFIDADHSYAAVCADISAWLPKVKPGGVLAGHDYSATDWPHCFRAVNDTLGNLVKPVSRSSWMVQL